MNSSSRPLNRYPWKYDPRSKKFSHHQFFGTVAPTTLPATLGRPQRQIENQGQYNRCAAYGGALNGGFIRGVRMSPDYQAAKISQEQNQSIDIGGSNPSAAMNSQVDYGYLPYDQSPLTVEANGSESSDPTKYPSALDAIAQQNRAYAYVSVDGPAGIDLFDQIRSALFQAYDSKKKLGAVIQVFSPWYIEWNGNGGGVGNTQLGMMPQGVTIEGYHSYDIIDFTSINGIEVLIIQNSWGTASGSGGYFFMPRAVCNAQLTSKMLSIPKPMTADQIALAAQETPAGVIQRLILSIWYTISKSFYAPAT